jgi:serine/threonine protein kinase
LRLKRVFLLAAALKAARGSTSHVPANRWPASDLFPIQRMPPMPTAEERPDRRVLEDFLLGRLPDADADRVASCLDQDPSWQALADGLDATDVFIEAVRSSAETPPLSDSPSLCDLITRLERLCLAAGTTRIAQPETARDILGPPNTCTDLSFLRPPLQPDELGRLGPFRVLKVLGKGGMGLVFRAEDTQLRRHIALKVIKPERAADTSHRERFLREARVAGAFQHDYVISIHQIGEDNGVLFLAMPLLAGETLEDRLRRECVLPVGDILLIGRQIAEGLAAAHAHGLIHRDIKPNNIWLERPPLHPPSLEGEEKAVILSKEEARKADGSRVKILDFGLAQPVDGGEPLTQSGQLLGTPAYMSPEQADGQLLDHRSDLFSLGCVLYRMATGKQPFARETLTATLRAVAEHQPPAPHEKKPGVPPALSHLIVQLMAKLPGERPPSAHAVAENLRNFEAGRLTSNPFPGWIAASTPPEPRPLHGTRRWWSAVFAVMLASTFLVVGVVASRNALWPFDGSRSVSRSGADPALAAAPPGAAWEGRIDVQGWREFAGQMRPLRQTHEGMLLLRANDRYRITATLNSMAHLYLFRIDGRGEALPVYPWKPGKWGTRPATETPCAELSLPPRTDKGYTLQDEEPGVVTFVLVARRTPLSIDDVVLQRILNGLPLRRPRQDPRAAGWIEQDLMPPEKGGQKREDFEEADINDPVVQLGVALRDHVRPFDVIITGVSFASQGK